MRDISMRGVSVPMIGIYYYHRFKDFVIYNINHIKK